MKCLNCGTNEVINGNVCCPECANNLRLGTARPDADFVRVQRVGRLLGCGCERTGTVTVRKHNTGLVEWGYACKCGKTFKVHGSWDGKQPTQ